MKVEWEWVSSLVVSKGVINEKLVPVVDEYLQVAFSEVARVRLVLVVVTEKVWLSGERLERVGIAVSRTIFLLFPNE